ncbi:hypothetical protein [Listeria costaricensis]|uniref:hypothetical protein n=1 Tax=Listeria costaricensis TaxID=2026604 RepID=UPI000C084888|nr:hypothetical protein [Listeria costaricensis]
MAIWQDTWQKWRETTAEMETEIKREAAEKVKQAIMASDFDRATGLIAQTKNLLQELDFETRLQNIESELARFSDSIADTKPFEAAQLSGVHKPEQPAKDFPTFKKTALMQLGKNDFQLIQEDEANLQLLRDNRNYYLTLIQQFDAAALRETLAEKQKYKNIGFICENEQLREKVKDLTQDWLKTIDESKRKFLKINLTDLELLRKKQDFIEL